MANKIKVAVLGASGYTGAEAVRLILSHPRLELAALTGHSRAGQPYAEVYPQFSGWNLPDLQMWEDVDWTAIDVVFACLPHGASQETVAQVAPRVSKVIDLSADFRLKDSALYETTYGRPHEEVALLASAAYGLSEFNRDTIAKSDLIACPGCYPTCSLLAILPGVQAGLISGQGLIIDAKSGVTGAGRSAKASLIYSELADGAHPYGIGTHRHTPEIEQALSQFAGAEATVVFTPHLIPMNRGMIATVYAKLEDGQSADSVREAYLNRYANEPFVQVLAAGDVPQTRHIRASNHAQIGIFKSRDPEQVIIVSVIDNLTKGSSGQAVQNLNIMMGWEETLGLSSAPVFP